MKESYNANDMKSPQPISSLPRKRRDNSCVIRFYETSGACHPERSDRRFRPCRKGSQLTDEPRLPPRSLLNFLYVLYLLYFIRLQRPPRSPPAFPAQSACSLPPCSSPDGSLRKIRRALAPPSPTPRCW